MIDRVPRADRVDRAHKQPSHPPSGRTPSASMQTCVSMPHTSTRYSGRRPARRRKSGRNAPPLNASLSGPRVEPLPELRRRGAQLLRILLRRRPGHAEQFAASSNRRMFHTISLRRPAPPPAASPARRRPTAPCPWRSSTPASGTGQRRRSISAGTIASYEQLSENRRNGYRGGQIRPLEALPPIHHNERCEPRRSRRAPLIRTASRHAPTQLRATPPRSSPSARTAGSPSAATAR